MPGNLAALKVAFITITVYSSYFKLLKSGFEPPKLECQSELGMKNGKIPNAAITATSVYSQYYGPERARLDTVKSGSYAGAWIPKANDLGQWIQADLGKITKITRIATQGRQDAGHWVKSYSLTYSFEGGPFLPYSDNQVCNIFIGRRRKRTPKSGKDRRSNDELHTSQTESSELAAKFNVCLNWLVNVFGSSLTISSRIFATSLGSHNRPVL